MSHTSSCTLYCSARTKISPHELQHHSILTSYLLLLLPHFTRVHNLLLILLPLHLIGLQSFRISRHHHRLQHYHVRWEHQDLDLFRMGNVFLKMMRVLCYQKINLIYLLKQTFLIIQLIPAPINSSLLPFIKSHLSIVYLSFNPHFLSKNSTLIINFLPIFLEFYYFTTSHLF